MASEAIKRLREKAASNGERGYVSIVLKIDECLVLLDIAEAAQAVAQEGAHPPMGEWIRRMQMLRAALAKVEAP